MRSRLLELRRLIFDTASRTKEVGELVEALKWGQPSYLTTDSGSGSTIRIGKAKDEPGKYSLFVHCQTDLLESFRELYPRTFEYRGNRELKIDAGRKFPDAALRHCIALALTYHARKPKRGKR